MMVGVLKASAVHCSRQQSLVAEWLGISVTVRVRARARKWDFSLFIFYFYFLSVLKATNTFALHVNGSCNVHGVEQQQYVT